MPSMIRELTRLQPLLSRAQFKQTVIKSFRIMQAKEESEMVHQLSMLAIFIVGAIFAVFVFTHI